jgi:hypothetical protein
MVDTFQARAEPVQQRVSGAEGVCTKRCLNAQIDRTAVEPCAERWSHPADRSHPTRVNEANVLSRLAEYSQT